MGIVYTNNKKMRFPWYKKYWNLFLNRLIPSRRERLLEEITRLDQEGGLYDEWDEDHAHDMVLNQMLDDLTEEEIDEIMNAPEYEIRDRKLER